MIKLPVTENEFEIIIKVLKQTNPPLYAKLWAYKMNYLNTEKTNGLS